MYKQRNVISISFIFQLFLPTPSLSSPNHICFFPHSNPSILSIVRAFLMQRAFRTWRANKRSKRDLLTGGAGRGRAAQILPTGGRCLALRRPPLTKAGSRHPSVHRCQLTCRPGGLFIVSYHQHHIQQPPTHPQPVLQPI